METTNPRFFPGNISGLGMQSDDNGRAVDTRYGINTDTTNGCLIQHPLDEITIAYAMDGTLEGTTDRVRALYLLTPTMAGQIVSELTAMLLRADPSAAATLVGRLAAVVSTETEPAPRNDTLIMPEAGDGHPVAA